MWLSFAQLETLKLDFAKLRVFDHRRICVMVGVIWERLAALNKSLHLLQILAWGGRMLGAGGGCPSMLSS
jgi:hypothetical protein